MTGRSFVAVTLAALLVVVRTTAAGAGADIESPAALDEVSTPARAPAVSILRDPVRSPLLDRHYQGPGVQTWTPVPAGPGREVFDRRFQIVYTAQPRPGMRVADIGAGSGDFTVLFARAVGPEGVVYAVDSAPDLDARLRALAKEYRVENMVPVVDTQTGSGLPAAGVDLAFVHDTDPRVQDPRALLDSIRKALVPYGTLIVLGDRHPPAAGSPGAGLHPPADRDTAAAQVQEAGFRLVDEPGFLDDNYFLRFEKLGDEPDIRVGPIESAAPTGEP